jgi:hypothetical protein
MGIDHQLQLDNKKEMEYWSNFRLHIKNNGLTGGNVDQTCPRHLKVSCVEETLQKKK